MIKRNCRVRTSTFSRHGPLSVAITRHYERSGARCVTLTLSHPQARNLPWKHDSHWGQKSWAPAVSNHICDQCIEAYQDKPPVAIQQCSTPTSPCWEVALGNRWHRRGNLLQEQCTRQRLVAKFHSHGRQMSRIGQPKLNTFAIFKPIIVWLESTLIYVDYFAGF